MPTPRYVERFRDTLLGVRPTTIPLASIAPGLTGTARIKAETRIQYNMEPWQLLGRHHEYTVAIKGAAPLEVSLQLYMNTRDHWRLFAYCKEGMLLSVNLTLAKGTSNAVELGQTLAMHARDRTTADRLQAAEALAARLRGMGLDVSDTRHVVFGTFDGRRGTFMDTTPAAFIKDFTTTAILKGHYMGNKGYSLGLAQATAARTSNATTDKRSVPLGLRFQILERDEQRCRLCGADPSQGIHLHVDHVIPWSKGGKTTSENLQTLCNLCNIGKGNRSSRRYGPKPTRNL